MPSLPTLAVVFSPGSLDPLTLLAAGRDVWNTVWVVDETHELPGDIRRLMTKIGPVVTVDARDPASAAALVSATAPSGVVGFQDDCLRLAADLGRELGCPGHSEFTASALLNKLRQRRALAAGGVPTPPFAGISAPYDAARYELDAEGATWPAVLKPQSSAGSRNTFFVPDEAALARALAQIEPDESGRYPDMIVEGFLPGGVTGSDPRLGNYVSVESAATSAGVVHFAITGRYPPAEPFRETGSFSPSCLDDAETDAVVQLADQALKALDITVGCVHTEIKLTDDGPRVIEVNGRLGGGGIPALLRRVAGLSVHRVAGLVALGRPSGLSGLVRCDGVGYFFAIQPPAWATSVVDLIGIDDIATLPGVTDVAIHHRPGDALDWRRNGSYDYVFTVSGTAADHEGMFRTLAAVNARAQLSYAGVDPSPTSG